MKTIKAALTDAKKTWLPWKIRRGEQTKGQKHTFSKQPNIQYQKEIDPEFTIRC